MSSPPGSSCSSTCGRGITAESIGKITGQSKWDRDGMIGWWATALWETLDSRSLYPTFGLGFFISQHMFLSVQPSEQEIYCGINVVYKGLAYNMGDLNECTVSYNYILDQWAEINCDCSIIQLSRERLGIKKQEPSRDNPWKWLNTQHPQVISSSSSEFPDQSFKIFPPEKNGHDGAAMTRRELFASLLKACFLGFSRYPLVDSGMSSPKGLLSESRLPDMMFGNVWHVESGARFLLWEVKLLHASGK